MKSIFNRYKWKEFIFPSQQFVSLSNFSPPGCTTQNRSYYVRKWSLVKKNFYKSDLIPETEGKTLQLQYLI